MPNKKKTPEPSYIAENSSCKTDTSKQKSITISDSTLKQVIGKKFFEYDAIDYYFYNFSESIINEVCKNKYESEIDSFKDGIITKNIPKDINDLTFIKILEKINYKKTFINKSKFESIDSLFVEKYPNEMAVAACIPVYRDILIFKKRNKVIGTVKISFTCGTFEIKGTQAITENFGGGEDLEKLYKLLRN